MLSARPHRKRSTSVGFGYELLVIEGFVKGVNVWFIEWELFQAHGLLWGLIEFAGSSISKVPMVKLAFVSVEDGVQVWYSNGV